MVEHDDKADEGKFHSNAVGDEALEADDGKWR